MKEFKPSRIFRSKLVKEHREELIRFIDRAKGEYAKKLQFDWQRFLQLSIADCVRHVKELRGQFIENFALEIKNKVMRNKGLAEKTICPIAIGQLKAKIEGFGLLEPI